VYDKPLSIEQNLKMLAAAASVVANLVEGLSLAQLAAHPEPGEWSVRDVLAHLRACSDMWGNCIVKNIQEDHPTFKAINPTTWIKSANYLELEFRPSLKSFTIQRAELVAELKPLSFEGWSRMATVTGAGKFRERAVRPCTH
jgi:uncharacterized damage-inducible protein DinB